jgi:hypothetical protein
VRVTFTQASARARQELEWARGTGGLFRPSLKSGEKGTAVPRDDTVLWLDGTSAMHCEKLPQLLAVEQRLALLGAALGRTAGSGVGAPTSRALELSSRSGGMVSCYDGGGAQYTAHFGGSFHTQFSYNIRVYTCCILLIPDINP